MQRKCHEIRELPNGVGRVDWTERNSRKVPSCKRQGNVRRQEGFVDMTSTQAEIRRKPSEVLPQITYTAYSDQSWARSLTRATDAGASDISWNSSWDCSPLSPSTITHVSDQFIIRLFTLKPSLTPYEANPPCVTPTLGGCISDIPAASMKEEKSFPYPIYVALII